MDHDLAERTRSLLRTLIERGAGSELQAFRALDELFDEPARIAVAGMVNAGKSTLLNALVGERVAPTDAGECTRIPTWYRRGQHYEVRAVDRIGEEGSPLRFARGDQLAVDLAHRDPATVDHLVVACPSTRLGHQTLIDLPGHSSLSADVSRRAEEFLVADDGTPVDGVIYLLRHRHPADLEFLESFHGSSGGRGAVGAIGVLSRADEAFGGGLESMDQAGRVAAVLRADRRVRGLCQDVVPVAGLLAESAASLRHDEVSALRGIAGVPAGVLDEALSSVDAFRELDHAATDTTERTALLQRLGLFGVRSAIDVLRRDPARTGDALSSDLLELSGIGQLRHRLDSMVIQRVSDLRARVVLGRLAQSEDVRSDPAARAEWERIEANAHGLRELDAVALLRRTSIPGITGEAAADLERLLGVHGVGARDRLGAPPTVGRDQLRNRVIEQHGRWVALRESPLAAPVAVQLASVGVRTCEAMLASDAGAAPLGSDR